MSTNPDAELITACAEFDTLERAYIAANEVSDADAAAAAELERITALQEAIVERIMSLPAKTPAGAAAVAASLTLYAPDMVEDGHDTATLLTHAVLRNAMALGAAQPGPSPDAELLDLCRQFHAQEAIVQASTHDDEALDTALEKRWEISNEISDFDPETPAGWAGKARVAAVLMEENGNGQADASTQFAYALIQGLAGTES